MSRPVQFAVECGILWAAGMLGGAGAARIGTPRVVGELLTGIFLGPTVFGIVAPSLESTLFPTETEAATHRALLTSVIMILFLFGAGLEIRKQFPSSERRAVGWIALFGMALPFCLATAAVFLFPGQWQTPSSQAWKLSVLLGAALSLTALPVILRILDETGLLRQRIGRIIAGAATLDDLAGWFLLTLLVLLNGGRVHWGELAIVSFYAGALVPTRWTDAKSVHVFQKVSRLLSPICFVAIGLKVNLLSDFRPAQATAVFVLATLGKAGGAYLGARRAGLSGSEARAVAFGMNARGAIEILLATVALETGLIEPALFVSLVTMALATTVWAGYSLRRYANRAAHEPT